MKNTTLAFILLFLFTNTLVSQSNPLINDPSISPDGRTIAFNYQGDIWTSSINGTNLKRLTIHEGYDTNPVWNSDGTTIAFQSNRFGNNDVFTISNKGGVPKRITYHSANDIVTDFTNNNNIIFSTSRNFVQIEREPEIHNISASGGTPIRLLSAVGFDAVLSPNNKFIAFTRGSCRIEREAYRGPANRDIWLYDIEKDIYQQLTTYNGQDLAPQWADNKTIYFQSARSGKYNVHKLILNEQGQKENEVSQLTFLTDMGISSFSSSENGKKIILNSGDKVYLLEQGQKELKPIAIEISSDYRFDPIERKSFTNNVTTIAISPDGNYRAQVVRGEIFINQNDTKKSKSVNVSNSSYRDIDPKWLNDDTLLFISDRKGINNIFSVTSTVPDNKNLFTTLKHKVTQLTKSKEGISNIKISPDKKQIAFRKGNGKLIIASITPEGKISNEKTLLNDWGTPSNIAWSPDSKWISYNLSDLYFNSEVYIHKADNSQKPVNISMHPKNDRGAMWSKDGSKIAFSSNRNNGDYDVWFVWLRKKDWEKTQQDWDEESDTKTSTKDKKSDAKKTEDIVPAVIIDFKDIHERQQQVTSFTGGEFLSAISKDGKTFYYTTGNGSRGNPKTTSNLYKIDWDGKNKKELTKGDARPRGIEVSSKEDFVYFISKGKTARINLKNSKKENLPYNAKMNVNYSEEANQIFEEAWKVIQDRFYDPNHHNRNWNELKKKYKPLAMKASTRVDFKVVFNNMLGQINASHMGMYRGEDRKSVQNERTGILGVELKTNKKGQLIVANVVHNSAADREISKLKKEDIILSVNGTKVSAQENIYKHLADTMNEKIILEILSDGKKREVVIRPKSNGRTDNYNAWIKKRKQLTDIYSNGRLGYIHIQGMNWTSFERFERELTAAGLGKEGVVIDVRYNGGSWTTDYLMAVLNVKQHAYTVPRGASNNLSKDHKNFKEYYPFSERLPLASWTKPSIALCNQNSYSNAEIFSHAYKELNLGKLVGTPTFGAVISTGGHTLIDGSFVRVPFRGWFVKSSEKNMDFTPAIPDIIVDNLPDDKAKGNDSQLKKAVEELLKELK